MSVKARPKKAGRKKDWHPADIVAAIRKAGWSLRKLSLHHGYADASTLSKAIERPWPKGQKLIADAIGVPPEKIWPSRYEQNSTPARANARKGETQGKAA